MVQRLSKKVKKAYPFESEDTMQAAIAAFRTGKSHRFLWTHQHHILATCWLIEQDSTTALKQMKKGIRRVNKALGLPNTATSGYHETVTCFWYHVIRDTWAKLSPKRSFFARANEVARMYGNRKDLLLEYYSRDVIMSMKARKTWIEPDLKALPTDLG